MNRICKQTGPSQSDRSSRTTEVDLDSRAALWLLDRSGKAAHHTTSDVNLLQLRHSSISRSDGYLPHGNVQRVLGCDGSQKAMRNDRDREVDKDRSLSGR